MDNIVLSPVPLDKLLQSFREIVRQEIAAEQSTHKEEKLISPAETCKLFNPPISKVTLTAWTKLGYLQDHRIGGRIFYKQSEIIESAKTLKKYKTS